MRNLYYIYLYNGLELNLEKGHVLRNPLTVFLFSMSATSLKQKTAFIKKKTKKHNLKKNNFRATVLQKLSPVKPYWTSHYPFCLILQR